MSFTSSVKRGPWVNVIDFSVSTKSFVKWSGGRRSRLRPIDTVVFIELLCKSIHILIFQVHWRIRHCFCWQSVSEISRGQSSRVQKSRENMLQKTFESTRLNYYPSRSIYRSFTNSPKNFSLEELKEYKGQDGKPIFISVKGKVYNVESGII